MPLIRILSVHCPSRLFVSPLQEQIQHQIGWESVHEEFNFDCSFAFNSERDQYSSTKLLLSLRNYFQPTDEKILAVTSLDLFIPILTFVFGEAQLNGPTAIISSFRLKPEYYGLPPDNELVAQRLVKEAIHELGHSFGLVHCRNMECVLHSSTYVEEIDLKRAEFCDECKSLLEENIQRLENHK